jgi:DNA invertase Pin-like site-specific DNA recombinase
VIVGFARVSTEQRTQDISIAGQKQQLLRAGCDRVITERASAYQPGKKREGWEELWALVASGTVREVVTIDQSRLSRSGDDLDFLQACALKGVTVRALSGGVLETESYSGFVTAGVLSVMNRAQSKLISAKVKEGIKRRRDAGFYGSGNVPFGYQHLEGKLCPHPEQFAQARIAWEQLAAMEFNVNGWIARYRSHWATQTGLRGWIKNPILRGIVRGQFGAVEALITFQEWEQAKQLLAVRSHMRGTAAAKKYLFTSLVKCAACQKNLSYAFSYRPVPRLKCINLLCDRYGNGLRVQVAREQVVEALLQRSKQMAELASQPLSPAESPEQQTIRAEIMALEQLKHLPGVPALIKQQKAQLAALSEQPTGPRSELFAELFADPSALALATDEELRPILIEFIAQILWTGGNLLAITLR